MKMDLQDGLLIAGVLALVGGIAAFSIPSASIVLGLLCFGAVYLIESAGFDSVGERKSLTKKRRF